MTRLNQSYRRSRKYNPSPLTLRIPFPFSFLTSFLYLPLLLGFATLSFAQEFRPVAVWSPTEPLFPIHCADKMIDGDLATFACLLDDSRTGQNESVVPPKGSTPVTGLFVLDLGQARELDGIKFVASGETAPKGPRVVSLFICDDQQGAQNVRWLFEKRSILSTRNSYSSFVYFPKTTTRYLGVRIDDSNEGDRGGWLGQTIRQESKRKGKSYAGIGDKFLVQIAEAVPLLGKPSDLRAPNPPEVAYPQDRLQRDWLYQDFGLDVSACFRDPAGNSIEKSLVEKVLTDLDKIAADPIQDKAEPSQDKAKPSQDKAESLRTQLQSLLTENVPGVDARWRDLYYRTCALRRQVRLSSLPDGRARRFVYVKHFIFGGPTIIEASEDQLDQQPVTDAWHTAEWRPGSQLCLAEILPDGSVRHEVLLNKPQGLIRDPNLTWDQKTLVFSMRDNFQSDNYHLYKMNLDARTVQQITFDPPAPAGFVPKRSLGNKPLTEWPESRSVPCSDTEPCITPNGDIIFSSTRCGIMDICWPMRTANLYTCDMDGNHLRRLGFDQLHTMYPQVQSDGRITFTRWEYNDRTATFLQPLIQMNPDGTAQTEFYGNNSWYPTSIIHARGVPGSSKAIAIVSGHHVLQKGKLALIDRTKGTQENAGIEFVAGASPDYLPGRSLSQYPTDKPSAPQIDCLGHDGPEWNYPFAFDESNYLVSFSPEGYYDQFPFCYPPFGVYYMDDQGARELLAFDWSISCVQPVPIQLNPVVPANRVNVVDLENNWGQFYVQNVYLGPGLEGVPNGTIKKLRVVALEYRLARIGMGSNKGPYEHGNVHTPISFNSGSWDVKHVLGEVDVESDGSAFFEVPANVPVYFQCLDERGRCVQTMRSWATLMPGEQFACLGCHENKADVGLASQRKITVAMKKPIQKLQPMDPNKPHPLLVRRQNEPMRNSLENYLGVQQVLSLDPEAPVEGFSYMQQIQPIWDAQCVSCHDGKTQKLNLTAAKDLFADKYDRSWDHHKRQYATSYVQLINYGRFNGKTSDSPWVSWYFARQMPAMLPPYSAGSTKSVLMNYLEPSHYNVKVTDLEKRTVACWIDLAVPYAGSYGQDNVWTDAEKAEYKYFQDKQTIFADRERQTP